MTRPTDAAIRRAYQELKDIPLGEWWYAKVLERAAVFDAESPAVPALGSEEDGPSEPLSVCSQHRPPVPNCFACGTILHCSRCTAHMPFGKHCGGPNCPLRPA